MLRKPRVFSSTLQQFAVKYTRKYSAKGVEGIGANVFAEISLLAAKHGAVNLGQGFPSFHTPEYVNLYFK
jgi:hypothetical protein